MHFLTRDEAAAWVTGRGFSIDADGHPVHRQTDFVCVPLSKIGWTRLTWLSGYLASFVEPYDQCLLWVTLWEVWPSSENLHLFYRLRDSYGERRLLHAAPGHLFLKHEAADLATYIQLAIIFGWDFHLLPGLAYSTAFGSHDEFVHLHANSKEAYDVLKKKLDDAEIEFSTHNE